MNKWVKKRGILIKFDENTFKLTKSSYFIHLYRKPRYNMLWRGFCITFSKKHQKVPTKLF